jgi:hypothetical protein
VQKGWLTRTVGGRKIEHIPCPHPNVAVDLDAPAVGVLHTIEGSIDSGMSVFRRHYAPHFTLDDRQIIQLIPLGFIGAACENHVGGVETNFIVRAQIEVAGRSKTKSWLPDAGTMEALADLMATLERAADIPLTRPFSDQMPPLPWAVMKFSRRNAGKWGKTSGWFGHVEVPENRHWDPGAFRWKEVLDLARTLAASPDDTPNAKRQPAMTKPPRPIPDWFWTWLRWRLGAGEFKRFGPHNMKHRPELPFGGKGQKPIPAWAWNKLGQFTAARQGPHP